VTYSYGNTHLNGFWDDNLEVPTIYLDPVEEPVIYDARDAWAQSSAPIVASSGDWNFNDLLKAGTAIAQEAIRYQTATLPDGQRIYTRIDPITGRPIYGGRTVTVDSGGIGTDIAQFVNQNMPLLLIAGAGLLLLSMKKGRK